MTGFTSSGHGDCGVDIKIPEGRGIIFFVLVSRVWVGWLGGGGATEMQDGRGGGG